MFNSNIKDLSLRSAIHFYETYYTESNSKDAKIPKQQVFASYWEYFIIISRVHEDDIEPIVPS